MTGGDRGSQDAANDAAMTEFLNDGESQYCSQCGDRYEYEACGPTHALIAYERGLSASPDYDDLTSAAAAVPDRAASGDDDWRDAKAGLDADGAPWITHGAPGEGVGEAVERLRDALTRPRLHLPCGEEHTPGPCSDGIDRDSANGGNVPYDAPEVRIARLSETATRLLRRPDAKQDLLDAALAELDALRDTVRRVEGEMSDWPDPNYSLLNGWNDPRKARPTTRGNLRDPDTMPQETQQDCPHHHYVGEVHQEAYNSHLILDLLGVPGLESGMGDGADLDARVSVLAQQYAIVSERLDRIIGLHVVERGEHGTLGTLCNQCGEPVPCYTAQVANGTDNEDADAALSAPAPTGGETS